MILFVCINLAQNALVDVWTILALVGGLAVLLFTEAQPYVLVVAGLILGVLRVLIIT